MLEAYLAFCIQARVANTFAAFARTNVHVNNDVAISVSPTIGMRIGATDHVLILSMRKCSPNRHYQQAVNFFLGRAITAHPAYLGCRTGAVCQAEGRPLSVGDHVCRGTEHLGSSCSFSPDDSGIDGLGICGATVSGAFSS